MIHTQDADFTLLCGDVLDELAMLPDESVHCVVTSPPYWGLRDYGADGQIGLEPTPELYVARIVEVFREVRRVLRADGTCWVNLGDSYAAQGGGKEEGQYDEKRVAGATWQAARKPPGGLKPKDLCGIPWRTAFALQADGWYLRSDIIWAKPNPMPESVTDRPTKAHEYVFLLSKGPRYFFDQEAVREPYNGPMYEGRDNGAILNGDRADRGKTCGMSNPAGRNVRSVWDIATQPYPEAHFATYPEELVRRCVLAGSSERGCCPVCGKPWEREVERQSWQEAVAVTDAHPDHPNEFSKRSPRGGGNGAWKKWREQNPNTVVDWHPGCKCCWLESDDTPAPIPCTVLDPFLGSGTTAYVARKHGRRSIGIELNPEYADLAARRMSQQSLLV